MQGRRLPDRNGLKLAAFKPGDYGKVTLDGEEHWYIRTPSGVLGNIDNHTVTEHEDGTITASPSILVTGNHEPAWHGYLERGVWRSV